MKKFVILITLLLPLITNAQDFVYRPINPAFGGNYYNYNWLLSSADAQKDEEAEDPAGINDNQDQLAEFTENLNNQILNEITDRILQEQFGEFTLEDGTQQVGNYQIQVTDESGGVNIRIYDTQTGGESNITIPSY